MKLPFTLQQFRDVFQHYNQDYWPIQVLLYAFATSIIFLLFTRWKYRSTAISFILSFFWIWMGLIYHLTYFSFINKAAYLFAILFILQAIIFFTLGVFKDRLVFHFHAGLKGVTGMVFVIFAIIIYPVIGHFLGHVYPGSPTFGLPCPTTIFTLGILLFAEERPPKAVVIIPLLWSVIGFSASFTLGFYEDVSLIVAGLTTAILWFSNKSKMFGKVQLT